MAKLTATRIRAFFAGVFALVLVVLLTAVGTAMFGMDIPVLGTIARTIGIDPAAHMSEEVSISQ